MISGTPGVAHFLNVRDAVSTVGSKISQSRAQIYCQTNPLSAPELSLKHLGRLQKKSKNQVRSGTVKSVPKQFEALLKTGLQKVTKLEDVIFGTLGPANVLNFLRAVATVGDGNSTDLTSNTSYMNPRIIPKSSLDDSGQLPKS